MTPVWQCSIAFHGWCATSAAAREGGRVPGRGKEIELDRQILDELAIRSYTCCETPSTTASSRRRSQARQKNQEGEIVLSAVRERSSVAISISDDGRGIDRSRILAKAQREGIVGPHVEALSDDQLLRVLARPGSRRRKR